MDQHRKASAELLNELSDLRRRVDALEAERKKLLQSRKTFEQVFQAAPDALIIVNSSGIIELLNRQTEQIFGYEAQELLGEEVEILIPHDFRAGHSAHRSNYLSKPVVRPMGTDLDLYGRRKDGSEFPAEISLSPLRTEEGMVIAAVRDATDRKIADGEREKLIVALQAALDDVKLLSGLIPICATCKKIRNDSGFWQQVEGYIADHSGARFSHGICPDCYEKAIDEFERNRQQNP